MERFSWSWVRERLAEFWALVVDVWREGAWGIDVAEIVIALAVFAAFVLARKLLARFVIGALKRVADRTPTLVDDELVESLRGPVQFVPIIMGLFFASRVISMDAAAGDFVDAVNRSLVVVTLFWALYALAAPLRRVLMHLPSMLTIAMVDWLVKVAKVVVVVLGAATILQMWGVAVAPIIAGLGLFGVAVALGAQGLFRNLIAGMFVIGEQRFNPGDWIRVEGVVEGTVESIGFRTTMIRQFDKAPVYVPNDMLADNAVINFSRMTYRRIMWVIGVEHRASLEQLKVIRDQIEDYVMSSDEFAHPPEVISFVRIDSFNENSVDILLYAFTKTTMWTDWMEIKERLAYRVKEIVEEAGASFAVPSRSVYLQTMPDAPEVFPLQPGADSAEPNDVPHDDGDQASEARLVQRVERT